MNAGALIRLDIVAKKVAGKLGRKEGQQILGVSERTKGCHFVRHGNAGKLPANRRSDKLKQKTIKLRPQPLRRRGASE